MVTRITRFAWDQTAAITDAIGTTAEIDYSEAICGGIGVPTGSSITSLTWYGARTAGGTYYPAYDKNGVAIVQTVAAARGYQFHEDLAGWRFLKAVGDVAGSIELSLKG